MVQVESDALLLLAYLAGRGAVVEHGLIARKINQEFQWSDEDFTAADTFLFDRKYTDGGAGWPDTQRWITPKGTALLAETGHLAGLTLDAARLLRAAIVRAADASYVLVKRTIPEVAHWTRKQFYSAAQELADCEYVEDKSRDGNVLAYTLFSVTQAGRNLYRGGFRAETVPATGNITTISIVDSQVGAIQTIGTAQERVQQIVNDPAALRDTIEALTQNLLEVVRGELSGPLLSQYTMALTELKTAMLAKEPDDTLLKQLLRRLGLMADIDGSLSLLAKVWPVLLQVAMLAARLVAH